MIAARIARRLAEEPAPRRSLMDRLLLDGMEWTDANPWYGVVGAVLTIIAGGIFEQATK